MQKAITLCFIVLSLTYAQQNVLPYELIGNLTKLRSADVAENTIMLQYVDRLEFWEKVCNVQCEWAVVHTHFVNISSGPNFKLLSLRNDTAIFYEAVKAEIFLSLCVRNVSWNCTARVVPRGDEGLMAVTLDRVVVLFSTIVDIFYSITWNGTSWGESERLNSVCEGVCSPTGVEQFGKYLLVLYSHTNGSTLLLIDSNWTKKVLLNSKKFESVQAFYPSGKIMLCSFYECALFNFSEENSTITLDYTFLPPINSTVSSSAISDDRLVISYVSPTEAGAQLYDREVNNQWNLSYIVASNSLGKYLDVVVTDSGFMGATTSPPSVQIYNFTYPTPIPPPADIIPLIVGSVIGALVATAGVCSLLIWYVRRMMRKKESISAYSSYSAGAKTPPALAILESYKLPITFQEHIGTGGFAWVYKGVYKGMQVAIKVQRDSMREGEKMYGLSHKYIIKVHKIFNRDVLSFLVMDYMPYGSLLQYYEKNLAKITIYTIIEFAAQIAEGMSELARNDIVHCDLRMSNILVAPDSTIRISDFGLSRDADYYLQQNSMMNIRWSPPEAFQTTCKIESSYDVWSYGVLLWELFSYPSRPFEYMKDPRTFGVFLGNGGRLTQPDRCPEEFFAIMEMCWRADPSARPGFPALVSLVRALTNGNSSVLINNNERSSE